jgi:futalosine hydrolase
MSNHPSPRPARRSVGAPALLLVPTALERRRIEDLGGLPTGLAIVETCGFGPLAAAARTAQLLALLEPSRVVLVGICGSYDLAEHAVGAALEFDAVAIEGIGVGEGAALLPPPALGFPQWPGSHAHAGAIFDRLELATLTAGSPPRLLLTTCAASADLAQARVRRERFPGALAEDMEGFAVALACALQGVPLRIVRGVSNEVGDRAPEHWRIPAALAAARELAIEVLSDDGWRA